MSIERFFVNAVTIITAGVATDRYDDDVADWENPASEIETAGWLVQTSTTESVGDRDVVVTGWKLYLGSDETISAANRISANDLIYEVDGEPLLAQTPAGPHHYEIELREVEDE